MFSHALRVTLALLLFRGGPQDFPFSVPISRACAVAAALASLLLMAPLIPLPLALAAAIGGVVGLAFFTRTLLRARKLENRLVQTLGAQYLSGALFALAMWPAFQALAPELSRLLSDPAALERLRAGQPVDMQSPPMWATLLSDLLFFWSLAVSVRINRLAADLAVPAGILLTIASALVMMSFVVLAQLMAIPLMGLFGLLPAVTPAAS
ncbi:MAG: hypothetical protein Q8Q73_14575 [Stagnimonas sp.]|nr:hypothetical protein [Stagnimonas sp.]